MIYSLDIDLYKDGFSHDWYNCKNIPIAGACGFYDYEYYYYYGFGITIHYNWGEACENIDLNLKKRIEYDCQEVLKKMGLQFQYKFTTSKEEFMNIILENIREQKPVLLNIKYRALFYNQYYRNREGFRQHILLIDKWNPNTEIFTVRDCSFFRGISNFEMNREMLFPLQLKEDMLWDIWKESLNQPETEEANKERILILEKIKNGNSISENQLLSDLVYSCRNKENLFATYVRNFNTSKFDLVNEYEVFCKHFHSCIVGMFHIIDYWFKSKEIKPDEEFIRFQEEYLSNRKNIIDNLLKSALKKRKLTDEKIEKYVQKIVSQDEMLAEQIERVNATYFQNERKYERFNIAIQKYMNNKAFGLSPQESNGADISGTGIYFIMNHDSISSIYQAENKNILNGTYGQYDNVSCKGQIIEFPADTYNYIEILAASEYGSYEEKVELIEHGQVVGEVPFYVSDFYGTPIYGEHIKYRGDTYQLVNNVIDQLDFNSRIFSYTFRTKDISIDSIKLPNRRNIHIFAISLLK